MLSAIRETGNKLLSAATKKKNIIVRNANKIINPSAQEKREAKLGDRLKEFGSDIENLYFLMNHKVLENAVSFLGIVNEYNSMSEKLNSFSDRITSKKCKKYYDDKFTKLKVNVERKSKSKIASFQEKIQTCKDINCIPEPDTRRSMEESYELYSLYKNYSNFIEQQNIISSHLDDKFDLNRDLTDGLEELAESINNNILIDNDLVDDIEEIGHLADYYASLIIVLEKNMLEKTYINNIKLIDNKYIFKNILNSTDKETIDILKRLRKYGFSINSKNTNNIFTSLEIDSSHFQFIKPRDTNYNLSSYDMQNINKYDSLYSSQFHPMFLYNSTNEHSIYYSIYNTYISNCNIIAYSNRKILNNNYSNRQLSCIFNSILKKYYSSINSILQITTKNTHYPHALLYSIFNDFDIYQLLENEDKSKYIIKDKYSKIFELSLKNSEKLTPDALVYVADSIKHNKYIYHDAMITMKLINDFGDDIEDYIHTCFDIFYCGLGNTDPNTRQLSKSICQNPYNINIFSIKAYNNYINLEYFLEAIYNKFPILTIDILSWGILTIAVIQETILKKYKIFFHGNMTMNNILLLPLNNEENIYMKNNLQIATDNNYIITGYGNSYLSENRDVLYANKLDNKDITPMENVLLRDNNENAKLIANIYDVLTLIESSKSKLLGKDSVYREVYSFFYRTIEENLGIQELFNNDNKLIPINQVLEKMNQRKNPLVLPTIKEVKNTIANYRNNIEENIEAELIYFETQQNIRKKIDCKITENDRYSYKYPKCKEIISINIVNKTKPIEICEQKEELFELGLDENNIGDIDDHLVYNTEQDTTIRPYNNEYLEHINNYINDIKITKCSKKTSKNKKK